MAEVRFSSLYAPNRTGHYRPARLLVGHADEAGEVAEAYLYVIRQTYGTGQSVVANGGGVLA